MEYSPLPNLSYSPLAWRIGSKLLNYGLIDGIFNIKIIYQISAASWKSNKK